MTKIDEAIHAAPPTISATFAYSDSFTSKVRFQPEAVTLIVLKFKVIGQILVGPIYEVLVKYAQFFVSFVNTPHRILAHE
jgi:hypothetical protein